MRSVLIAKCCFGNQMKRMRWAGHVVCMGQRRKQVLIGKPEGNRPLKRTRRQDNIKMYIQEVGRENGLDKYNTEQLLLGGLL